MEQILFEFQIGGNGGCEDKRHGLVQVQLRKFDQPVSRELDHFHMQRRTLFTIAAGGSWLLVSEEIDLCLKKTSPIVQRFNFKPAFPTAQYVHAAIRIP